MNRFEARFDDPEEMPERMSSVARNFAVRPVRQGPFAARLRAGRLGNVGLFRIAMTEARVISADRLGYFSINLPQSSPFQARFDGRTERYSGHSSYIARPEDPFNLQMPHEADVLVMNVLKPDLDDYAAALQGGTGKAVVHLPSALPLTHPAGQAFRRYLSYLWEEIERDSPLVASDLVGEELEKALLNSLLIAADTLEHHCEGIPSAECLQRAVEFIMEHLLQPLSLGDIAAASAVHARTLQRAFRARYDTSVMTFVRQRRLERAHEQLLFSDASTTSVTDIAVANGFGHLSRFSASYRRKFGELPSETLRR